jgi:hypothetical protein
VEARVCVIRRDHPGWGPQTIRHQLAGEQTSALPSRSGIYRALVRHRLIESTKGRRQRGDYRPARPELDSLLARDSEGSRHNVCAANADCPGGGAENPTNPTGLVKAPGWRPDCRSVQPDQGPTIARNRR